MVWSIICTQICPEPVFIGWVLHIEIKRVYGCIIHLCMVKNFVVINFRVKFCCCHINSHTASGRNYNNVKLQNHTCAQELKKNRLCVIKNYEGNINTSTHIVYKELAGVYMRKLRSIDLMTQSITFGKLKISAHCYKWEKVVPKSFSWLYK